MIWRTFDSIFLTSTLIQNRKIFETLIMETPNLWVSSALVDPRWSYIIKLRDLFVVHFEFLFTISVLSLQCFGCFVGASNLIADNFLFGFNGVMYLKLSSGSRLSLVGLPGTKCSSLLMISLAACIKFSCCSCHKIHLLCFLSLTLALSLLSPLV